MLKTCQRCISEHLPLHCPVNNVLQELLWKADPKPGFPLARSIDSFWWEELDIIAQGTQMLHKMIVQNTNIKCLQKNVFFFPNETTNPIICYELSNMPGPGHYYFVEPLSERTGLYQDLHFIHYWNYQPYWEYADQYGDIMHYKINRQGDIVLLSNPTEFKQIYESPLYWKRMPMEFNDYVYGRVAGFKDGQSVYGASNGFGERALLIRNLMLQAIKKEGMSSYFPSFVKHSKEFAAALVKNAGKKKYDPLQDIRSLSNSVQCELTLGQYNCQRNPKETKKVFAAMDSWVDRYIQNFTLHLFFTYTFLAQVSILKHLFFLIFFYSTFKLNSFGDFLPFVKPYRNPLIVMEKWKVDRHMDDLHVFIKRIIEERRATGNLPQYNDWMGEFMFGSINASVLTDTEVYPAVMDGLLGGAAQQFTVNWGLYQISQNPQILDKLYAEISEQLGSVDVDASNIHKLKYLSAFVMEIYRHQPGGGAIQARMALGENVVGGYEIPQDTNIVLNVLHLHRDKRFWDQPDTFDPERWIRVRI